MVELRCSHPSLPISDLIERASVLPQFGTSLTGQAVLLCGGALDGGER